MLNLKQKKKYHVLWVVIAIFAILGMVSYLFIPFISIF